MVKLAIIQPSGTYAIFQNSAQGVANDPLVIGYLDTAWNTYNRSASVYVNDSRVYLDKTQTGYTFATLIDQSDAEQWRNFILQIDPPNPNDPPDGGGKQPPTYNGKPIRLLIVDATTGVVDSGATYPTCSQSNQNGCNPVQFQNMTDAINYAYAHGEYPYQVFSSNEAWAIVAGDITIDPNKIIPPIPPGGSLPPSGGGNTTMYVVAGAAALLLLMNSK